MKAWGYLGLIALGVGSLALADSPPQAAADQAAVTNSSDAKLAANKRVVADVYRKIIQAGHVEYGPELVAENYIQHNPEIANGRAPFLEFVAARAKPSEITPVSRWPIISMVAEGDLVVVTFVRTLPDPRKPGATYQTTWFDMFRVENGKIAEHWDHAVVNDPAAAIPKKEGKNR